MPPDSLHPSKGLSVHYEYILCSVYARCVCVYREREKERVREKERGREWKSERGREGERGVERFQSYLVFVLVLDRYSSRINWITDELKLPQPTEQCHVNMNHIARAMHICNADIAYICIAGIAYMQWNIIIRVCAL